MNEIAIFGAGCFWGVEEAFRVLPGVKSTEVGYCGGQLPNPSYEEVCTDTTGHAEVVKIVFNADEISFDELMEVFFKVHNPTTLNRQGLDIGSQYRSVIFYTSLKQKDQSINFIEKIKNRNQFSREIVTQVVEQSNYFSAEEYHQKYLFKKGKTTCGI